jgi:peroxiredoxin
MSAHRPSIREPVLTAGVVAGIAFILFLIFAASVRSETPPPTGVPTKSAAPSGLPSATAAATGREAPDFELMDAVGKQRSLSENKGKFVVLEWVNYDCPFVKKQYGTGNMQKLQKEYTAKGVIWFSINSSAPGKQGRFTGEELAHRIAEAKAAPTAYLQDPDGKVGRLYQAKTTPTLFVINPKGEIVYSGAADDRPSTDVKEIPKHYYVREALDAALAGHPVPVASTVSYGCAIKYAD